MALPERDWFTLGETAEYLGCLVDDLFHYGETGGMEICFRLDDYKSRFLQLNHDYCKNLAIFFRDITEHDDWIPVKKWYVINPTLSDSDQDRLNRTFALAARDISSIRATNVAIIKGAFWGSQYWDFGPIAHEGRSSAFEAAHVVYPLINKDELVITRIERDRLANKPEVSQKPKPFSVFQSMDNLKFHEITLTFDDDNLVLRASARDKKRIQAPFASLDLTLGNGITLNKKGIALAEMARGEFQIEATGSKKIVARLSKILRDQFSTKDTPFKSWRPQFDITNPKQIKAKKDALKRTVAVTENTPSQTTDDPADQFLKGEDSAYKAGDYR